MAPTRNLTDPVQVGQGVDPEVGLKEPLFENITIPEHFGPVEVLIDEPKVRRFAFTQDDFNPWYFGQGPTERPIAPPAIVANDLLQLFTTKYAPSRVVGLHTDEELWFNRPIYVGETLTLSGRYVETMERRGQGCVVMDAEARDRDGDIVVRHHGIEIMRTAPGVVAGRSSAPTTPDRRVTGEWDHGLPSALLVGSDAVPGMRLAPLIKEITFEQMAVFSRIGEFVTNIHNSLEYARSAGLALPIVQGQQLVCHVSELLAERFGLPWFSTGWLNVKFLKPVAAFEKVVVSGVVRGVDKWTNTDVKTDVDIWISRADGSFAGVGWANCTIPTSRLTQANNGTGSVPLAPHDPV